MHAQEATYWWPGGTSETMVARVQAGDLQANPLNNNYLDMVAVGDQKMTYLFVLYNQADHRLHHELADGDRRTGTSRWSGH